MATEMTIVFSGGACVDAHMGDMVIHTDQPVQAGGAGSGPTPFALFLASLGTCAGIYVLSFCQQRGLPTEGIEIRQRMDSDPRTHMISQVTLDISLPAGFPEKYTAALVRSAELCAVKRHLENPPKFQVQAHIG